MSNNPAPIYIPAKQRKPVPENQRVVVRIDAKAYNALVEIYNESTLPMSAIASLLICEAAKRVEYIKEEEDVDDE